MAHLVATSVSVEYWIRSSEYSRSKMLDMHNPSFDPSPRLVSVVAESVVMTTRRRRAARRDTLVLPSVTVLTHRCGQPFKTRWQLLFPTSIMTVLFPESTR